MHTQRFVITKNRPLSSAKISHFMLNLLGDAYYLKSLYSRLITYNLFQKMAKFLGLEIRKTDKTIQEFTSCNVSGETVTNIYLLRRINVLSEKLKNLNKNFN